MTLTTILQFHNSTNCFATLVNHLERCRDVSNFHTINGLSNLWRQVCHFEAWSTAILSNISHQTVIITSILVIREECHTILKSKGTLKVIAQYFRSHTRTNSSSNRVQTSHCLLDSLIAHHRFTQDMTNLDFLTTFVNKLNDMESEFRLHNFRDFLGISQAKSDICKGWIQHATSNKVHLSTTTCWTRIFWIQTC